MDHRTCSMDHRTCSEDHRTCSMDHKTCSMAIEHVLWPIEAIEHVLLTSFRAIMKITRGSEERSSPGFAGGSGGAAPRFRRGPEGAAPGLAGGAGGAAPRNSNIKKLSARGF